MIVSALLLFGFGLVLTFAPGEAVHKAGGVHAPCLVALAQACGALYLGFGILNWMAKDNLIGGIYSRPVAMGNFLHFFTMAMALIKSASTLPHTAAFVTLTGVYAILAVAFGTVLVRQPDIH